MQNNENETNSNEKKVCCECKVPKELKYFCKNSKLKFGVNNRCKVCTNKRNKSHYKNNQEYFTKYREEYNKNLDKDLKVERSKKYYLNNREKSLAANKEYCKKNKKELQRKKTIQKRERYQVDPIFRMQINFRTRLNQFLKLNKESRSTSMNILIGCTWKECKQYIESKFKPEMNWENQGIVWELDHILPCASFNLLDEIEQKKCFHFTNLQPLFKTTEIAESFGYFDEIGNRNKGDRIF